MRKFGGRSSILVKDALNFVHVRSLSECERQQKRCLLRAQIVSYHHPGLVPVVAAYDAAFADTRALHHYCAALFDDRFQFFV
jgi:hypothetical protein